MSSSNRGSKGWAAVKRELKIAFHAHKFDEDALSDIERQLYRNAGYHTHSYLKPMASYVADTNAYGWFYCEVCCKPNQTVWFETSFDIGNLDNKQKVIEGWLNRHRATNRDFIKYDTHEQVTFKNGVYTTRPLEGRSRVTTWS